MTRIKLILRIGHTAGSSFQEENDLDQAYFKIRSNSRFKESGCS